jgi:hypothetical protein
MNRGISRRTIEYFGAVMVLMAAQSAAELGTQFRVGQYRVVTVHHGDMREIQKTSAKTRGD